MRGQKRFMVTGVIIIFGLLLAGCAPVATPTPTAKAKAPAPQPTLPIVVPTPQPSSPKPTPKPAAEKPRDGGVLTVSVHADPPTLDAQQETSYQVFNLVAPSYSGVLQYDPLDAEKIIGDLAQRWETSADGLTHTFYLNRGVKWHDGTTLNAEDIRSSLERHYDAPKGVLMPRAEVFTDVRTIEALDESTLRVTMKNPTFSFIPNLARGELPTYSKKFVETKGDMKKDVMGTGPFMFKNYEIGSRFEVVKFPDYFVRGRPYLDGVTFYIIKDASTRFGAFRTGRIQMTSTGDSSLNPSEAEMVDSQMKDKAVAVRHAWLRHGQLLFNHVKGPTKDVRVRRAVSLAVDRQQAVTVVAQGRGFVGGPMQPGSEWAIPQEELIKMPGYVQPKDRDRAEAKRLLNEAGFPDGFETTLPVRQGRSYENDAVFIKDQLAKIGIRANLQIQEYAVWSKSRTSTDAFDMLPIGSALRYPDPDDYTRYYHSSGSFNFGRFNNAEVDQLLSKQARTMDRAERRKVAIELQKKLLDLAAAVTICWPDAYVGVWLEVKNYKPGIGLSNNGKFQDVWLAK